MIAGAVSERFYDKTFHGIDWPSRVTLTADGSISLAKRVTRTA